MSIDIKELRRLEKWYFDTYKTKRTSGERASHLEEMALIIRQIENYEKRTQGDNGAAKQGFTQKQKKG